VRHIPSLPAVAIFLLGGAFAQSSNTSSNPQPTPAYQQPSEQQRQDIQNNLKDVHFAFDQYELTAEDRQSLEATANWLKANPGVYVTIAGDADERGGIVYNVYLSDQRAKATRDALVAMGVPENQIVFATGWGKLYPLCNQSDESCWAQNRRAHFEPWQAGSLAATDLFAPTASERAENTTSANLSLRK
jgi:outer membrane protein OmpA-like peptidoglycan-associated protein